MLNTFNLPEEQEERNRCMRYIRKRNLSQRGWEWCHEKAFDNEYIGDIINETDLMLMLKINGRYVWEKE